MAWPGLRWHSLERMPRLRFMRKHQPRFSMKAVLNNITVLLNVINMVILHVEAYDLLN